MATTRGGQARGTPRVLARRRVRIAVAACAVSVATTVPTAPAPGASAPDRPAPVRSVVGKAQTGELVSLPGIAQQGRAPAAPTDAGQLVAGFSPARPGRPVRLERLRASGWRVVSRGVQDPSGHVSFAVTASSGRFRAVAVGIARIPQVVTNVVSPGSWPLAFEDTFSGPALSPTVWRDQMIDSLEGVSATGRTCSKISPSARSLGGGVLRLGIAYDTRRNDMCRYELRARAENAHPRLLNSQVVTQDLFEFTYGFAAARMKLQSARGMHSAFWLQPTDIVEGPPALGTEIDVAEFFGSTGRDRDRVRSSVHWILDGAYRKIASTSQDSWKMKPPGDTWWDSYHVFSVEWTPTEYVFRIDGREHHRETYAISHVPEYLNLSMLTSNHELRNLAPGSMGETAKVDWVRVWSHDARWLPGPG